MKIKLAEHAIAEIRDKIDKWRAAQLNAKDLRDDIRALLEHIDALDEELQEANDARCQHPWQPPDEMVP